MTTTKSEDALKADEEAKLLEPRQEITGTVGDDVRTVHKLREGKPKCGETGKVTEWQRAASCSACLALP